MDEQQEPGPAEGVTFERTGVDAVDEVLDEIVALEGRPVAEHVVAFERAQDHLRRALDAPTEP